MTEFGIYCMESIKKETGCNIKTCSLHADKKRSKAARIRCLNANINLKDKTRYCYLEHKDIMINGFIRRKDENTKDSV